MTLPTAFQLPTNRLPTACPHTPLIPLLRLEVVGRWLEGSTPSTRKSAFKSLANRASRTRWQNRR
jgi:hypothetical protein